MSALVQHDWPGNVRELENEMRRVLLLAEDHVRIDHLTPSILETLAATGGNKTEAARRMGVSARTLSNKMKLWRQLGLVA